MAADTSFTLEGPLAKRGGRQPYEALVLRTAAGGAVQRVRRGTTVLVNGSEDDSQGVSQYVAYVREIFVAKRGADPELSVYWMYRPHETPRKPGSSVMWASAETSELFFSSHADDIPADSLVHCAVVRFLLTPPAPEAHKGAGFFAARVYEPSTGAVHTLESGNFAEPFSSEVRFIFEGPGRQRSAAAGAALPSDQAVALKPAKTSAPPKAAPGSKAAAPAEGASPSPAPPVVVQKPRGAPPPPPATVASTLREALRREETKAGRVRLLNQVASMSDEVRAALDVKDAAAQIAAWINLALRRGPPAGTEAANALLSAALKALDALQLPRPALIGPKGKAAVDAVRLTARSDTVAPAVRGEAVVLAARWRALIISSAPDGGAGPEPASGDEFFASPRSTEAAATLAAVARRPGGSGGAKTPLAASNGGGTEPALQPAKPTPGGKRVTLVSAADDDAAPPVAKRAKGATQLAAAAAEAAAEAAATRAVAGSAAALARAPQAQSKRRFIEDAVANALTAVSLALQLSRTARDAITAAAAGDDDEDADEAGALIQSLESMRDMWTAPALR